MIVSFRDAWLRDFFVEDVRGKKIPADLAARLFRKLQMLDDATTDGDLRVPPSNQFREAEGRSRRLAFDPSERAMAAGVPVACRYRRGVRRVSRQSQLPVR